MLGVADAGSAGASGGGSWRAGQAGASRRAAEHRAGEVALDGLGRGHPLVHQHHHGQVLVRVPRHLRAETRDRAVVMQVRAGLGAVDHHPVAVAHPQVPVGRFGRAGHRAVERIGEHPALAQRYGPLRQVGRRRAERPRGEEDRGIPRRGGDPVAAAVAAVAGGERRARQGLAVARVGHPQRRPEALAQHVVVRAAGDALDRQAQQVVAGVAVVEAGAGGEEQRARGQRVDQARGRQRLAELAEELGEVGHPRGVVQQPLDGDGAIRRRQPVYVAGDGIVEAKQPILRQEEHRRRGELLGHRRDLVLAVHRGGEVRPAALLAPAALQHHPAVHHDRHAQRADGLVVHRVPRDGIDRRGQPRGIVQRGQRRRERGELPGRGIRGGADGDGDGDGAEAHRVRRCGLRTRGRVLRTRVHARERRGVAG